jgi:hypothetical protein
MKQSTVCMLTIAGSQLFRRIIQERELEYASVEILIRNKQSSQGEVAIQERRTLEFVKSKHQKKIPWDLFSGP